MDIKKIVNNKFSRKILLSVFSLLSVVNKIIPKDKKKIMIYDSFNKSIEDNSRAMLNYLVENNYHKKYNIICAVPQNKDYSAYSRYGIKTVGAFGSICHYLTTRYFFTSFGNTRINPTKNQMIVNLWHGTPLKTIGHLGGDHKNEKIDYFSYTLASSDFFKPVMAKAFGCSEDKILVNGHPRNDYLFYKTEVASKVIGDTQYSKKILWMPTFRVSKDNFYSEGKSGNSETMLPVITTTEQYKELNEYLSKKNILLVIKVHNYSVGLKISNLSNIKIISNSDLDKENIFLYEFVKDFDSLITDYSSIYFDYLLLERPIGFTVDDYDEYKETRGFALENAIDYMPGFKIKIYSEFYNFIDQIANDIDDFSDERKKMNDLSNKYHDGQDRKRLLEFMGIEL